jgi:hypothetical protein
MKRILWIGLLLVLAFLVALPALARSPSAPKATFDLSWNTIEGGGAMNVSGGGYSLSGTMGQTDAGSLTGGSFSLVGGFWGGVQDLYNLSLPLIMR